MKKNSNIFLARILSLYRFSSNAIFYAPIVVLYFKDAFENELKSYILISAYTLTITIFEIPSGIFADVKGNYKALILGLFLSAGGTALLIVNSNFLIVLFGQILVGIGLSLKSGAESAFIRKVAGLPEQYQKIEARSAGFRYISLAVSSILGAQLFVTNYRLPFIITSLFLLFSSALLSLLPSSSDSDGRRSKDNIYRDMVSVFKLDFQFSLTFLFLTTIGGIMGLMYWTYALYLEEINYSIELIGVTFALLFIASSAGSFFAQYITRLSLKTTTFYTLCFVLSLVVICYGIVTSRTGVILIYLTQFLTGIIGPFSIMFVQQHIHDSVRASILSISSLCTRALQSLFILLFGVVHHSYSLSTAYFSLGISSIIILLIFLSLSKVGPRSLEFGKVVK